MKKYIFTNIFLGYISIAIYAQTWNLVGNKGFSGGLAQHISIAVDSLGTPYIAFSAHLNSFAATVQKFNGTNWVNVGTAGFSGSTQVTFTRIAIAPDGVTPYIVYSDGENGYKATVRKYNGTQWEIVGNALLSAGYAYNTNITFAPDGTPFLSYEDGGNGYKITVMKLSENQWVTVGNPGFSTYSIGANSIAISPNGVPYIAYCEATSATNSLVVQKFNGTNWQLVGNTSGNDAVQYSTLAISKDGTIYVAFENDNLSAKASIIKYSNSAWSVVGLPTVSVGRSRLMKIAITNDGTPYVAYADGNSNFATILKYTNSTWSTVGSTTSIPNYYMGFTVAKDGALFVAYDDYDKNNWASVIKYSGINTKTESVESSTKDFAVCYDKHSSHLQIDYELQTATWIKLQVFNLAGQRQVLLKNEFQKPGKQSVSFNTALLTKGIYIIEMQTETVSNKYKFQIDR